MHEPRSSTVTAARTPALTGRARVALALLAAMIVGLTGGAAPSGAAADPLADTASRVIVEARADLGRVANAVAEQGGRILEVLAPFGLVVAEVPATSVDALEADPATGSVTADTPMRVQSTETLDESIDATHTAVNGPSDAGEGVGVVIVDTGIAEHDDLDGRVVERYDLAPGGADDAHGHGTFMAGLVAGETTGIAPAADLVSVRVADADGSTTLARVLHGLAVADAAREVHDAPVVLLALSGEAGDAPDPLMMVLEMLWARGSTVVVAAGNDDEVGSPGVDPYLLTVGALDGEAIADFSAYGERWGHSKPDLVAPGTSVVSLLADGSAIGVDNPDSVIEDEYILGSGTSMAAALVAGAAAAVIADHSDAEPLTPDDVKGRLMGTADASGLTDTTGAGAGVLDVDAALTTDGTPAANSELADLPEPRGNLHSSRSAVAPGRLKRTAEGLTPAGWSWAGWSWAGWSWAGWSWAGGAETEWAGWSWAGQQWAGWSWAGEDWAGWSWAGDEWAGWSWAGWSWAGDDWAGWSWSAATWDAVPQ